MVHDFQRVVDKARDIWCTVLFDTRPCAVVVNVVGWMCACSRMCACVYVLGLSEGGPF